jgi:hypothetical protein
MCYCINELRHLKNLHTKQNYAYSGALEHCYYVYVHFMCLLSIL